MIPESFPASGAPGGCVCLRCGHPPLVRSSKRMAGSKSGAGSFVRKALKPSVVIGAPGPDSGKAPVPESRTTLAPDRRARLSRRPREQIPQTLLAEGRPHRGIECVDDLVEGSISIRTRCWARRPKKLRRTDGLRCLYTSGGQPERGHFRGAPYMCPQRTGYLKGLASTGQEVDDRFGRGPIRLTPLAGVECC